ncbi:hypothetical protein FAUST_11893, partial [Fusarium austroamericanum]
SLRKYLGDLKLTVETVSLELNIAIDQNLELISQDAATNSANQSDQLEAVRTQEQQNFDSLTSTVSSAHEFNKDQFHQTQWLVRDNDQKVNGRLTMMDTRLCSIAHDSGVTIARMEEMMKTLSSYLELLTNMDQHHRGCELFGIHRNKKRKVWARFPLRVAWLSARMTFACIEYTSGTRTPGHLVRYKNIVHSDHSPVIQAFEEIIYWDIQSMPGTRIVQEMEEMGRRIMSMYREGTASPYDRNEIDASHAAEKLGIFLESSTVTFADLTAASICKSLDKASIPIHPSLRVECDYKSIYSCAGIPFQHFRLFWESGFHDGWQRHDNLGLVPTMTYRFDMFWPAVDAPNIYDSYSWMHANGFLGVTPTDPLKLGFNLSSTSHHYIGAMFGAFYDIHWGRPIYTSDLDDLMKELSSVVIEDECNCWCNTTNHGCSPMKLLLKSYLDERRPKMDMLFHVFRHILFHNTISDLSPSPRGFATDLLRLLTFEALEMTHTCCSIKSISEYVVNDLVSTASEKPAAIFSFRDEKVQKIRSGAEERSSAHLLEDLMSEFNLLFSQQGSDAQTFERFIAGYWRRRISEIYYPDPQVLSEMKQHQAFSGLKASSDVETCRCTAEEGLTSSR